MGGLALIFSAKQLTVKPVKASHVIMARLLVVRGNRQTAQSTKRMYERRTWPGEKHLGMVIMIGAQDDNPHAKHLRALSQLMVRRQRLLSNRKTMTGQDSPPVLPRYSPSPCLETRVARLQLDYITFNIYKNTKTTYSQSPSQQYNCDRLCLPDSRKKANCMFIVYGFIHKVRSRMPLPAETLAWLLTINTCCNHVSTSF